MKLKEWRNRAVLTRPSAEEGSLQAGWDHVVRRGLVFKASNTTTTNPTPELVSESLEHAQKTKTKKTNKTKKYVSKHTTFPKQTPVTIKRQVGKGAKSKVENSKSTNLVFPPQRTQTPLEEISDLLDNLP